MKYVVIEPTQNWAGYETLEEAKASAKARIRCGAKWVTVLVPAFTLTPAPEPEPIVSFHVIEPTQ